VIEPRFIFSSNTLQGTGSAFSAAVAKLPATDMRERGEIVNGMQSRMRAPAGKPLGAGDQHSLRAPRAQACLIQSGAPAANENLEAP